MAVSNLERAARLTRAVNATSRIEDFFVINSTDCTEDVWEGRTSIDEDALDHRWVFWGDRSDGTDWVVCTRCNRVTDATTVSAKKGGE